MKRLLPLTLVSALYFLAPPAQADWAPVRRLTWTPGETGVPAIAIGSDNIIHVVWPDDTPGNFELYHRRSTDGGTTWSMNKRLTWTSGDSHYPAVATGPGNSIHIVWHDETPGNLEVYHKRSTDGGETWGATKRLTWTSLNSNEPDIAIDSGGTIHVVYYEYTPGAPETYYKKSPDGGATWSEAKRLTWEGSSRPAISIAPGGAIHVVWACYKVDNLDLYWRKSPDGGATWSKIKRLTWTAGDSIFQDMAVDSANRVHVVWYESTLSDIEIYYKRSSDGGATWSKIKRLTWTSDFSYFPVIAVDSGDGIHIVWVEEMSNREICYKKSTNGGIAWSVLRRLTWTPGPSDSPAMAIDSGKMIHVVWWENTATNNDVYYRKGN